MIREVFSEYYLVQLKIVIKLAIEVEQRPVFDRRRRVPGSHVCPLSPPNHVLSLDIDLVMLYFHGIMQQNLACSWIDTQPG